MSSFPRGPENYKRKVPKSIEIPPAPDPVTPEALAAWLTTQRPGFVVVLDVRSPEEFATSRIKSSINIPHESFLENVSRLADKVSTSNNVVIVSSASPDVDVTDGQLLLNELLQSGRVTTRVGGVHYVVGSRSGFG